MKRVLLLVSVALVMVAVMAAPAFATFHFDSKSKSQCNAGHGNGLENPPVNDDCDPGSGRSPYSNTGRIARLFRILERVGLSGVGIDGYPEVEAHR
jgi:hypothetical protein